MPARVEDLYEPDVIEAVGRVAIAASLLESSLVHLVGLLLRTDSTGAQIVTVKANFHWLNERCGALARDRLSGSLLDRVLDWLKGARSAMEERNDLIHSTWFRSVTIDVGRGTTVETGYRRVKVKKGSLETKETLADAALLSAIAEKLQDRWNEANALIPQVTEAIAKAAS